jgi:hypothetical protein
LRKSVRQRLKLRLPRALRKAKKARGAKKAGRAKKVASKPKADSTKEGRSDFSIHRVLCSVELNPHSSHTVSLAAEMAAAIDATLTLVHITGSVEIFGPGGSHVDAVWKEKIVGFAVEEIAKLQQEVGTKAEVIIDSGNVPELLNRAAERTKSDVLVIGHIPGRSHLGDNGNGYGIIRQSIIPVLSV